MTRYRSIPNEVEAMQFSDDKEEATAFCGSDHIRFLVRACEVKNDLEGGVWLTARLGDWIIKGTHEELYPCAPEVFARRYEPVLQEDRGEVIT